LFKEPKQFTSGDLFKKVMKGYLVMYPKNKILLVDVRDVAKAHIQALETGRDGGRYIVSHSNSFSFSDIGDVLRDKYKNADHVFPTYEIPFFVVWCLSWFDKRFACMIPKYDCVYSVDNRKSIDELGVEYQDVSESICQMADNLIDIGYIQDFKY
jgi:nucleoside-diphosphate-sugar epimerase